MYQEKAKIIGYIRSHKSYSVDVQKVVINEYVKRNGYELESLYIDENCSSSEYRPMYSQMITDIECGNTNAAEIVVASLDRINRNTSLLLDDLMLFSRKNLKLVCACKAFEEEAEYLTFLVNQCNEGAE